MTKQWGGYREGGGRPKGSGEYGVPTKPIRVPTHLISSIQKFIKSKQELALPLYSSRVKAGFPSPADDYLEGHLDLNEYLIKNSETTFYVRVSGDSMVNAGIFDNDLLLVDRSLQPSHGKIVIAAINGELTVKRLHKTATESMLMAENPKYSPIVLKEGDELHIWGIVTNVIKSV